MRDDVMACPTGGAPGQHGGFPSPVVGRGQESCEVYRQSTGARSRRRYSSPAPHAGRTGRRSLDANDAYGLERACAAGSDGRGFCCCCPAADSDTPDRGPRAQRVRERHTHAWPVHGARWGDALRPENAALFDGNLVKPGAQKPASTSVGMVGDASLPYCTSPMQYQNNL